MEAARRAVAEFTARKGHTTEVHETVRPAITLETVKPTRHEITTEAVDREVHQHHYHTTVQPLSHTETLPTKHTHNLIPIKHTTHHHGDLEATKARVAAELAVFKNHSMRMPVTHTNATLPPVIGEHYHHHVHEVVQPVVYKEVHAPEVVHTTIPIHETHHYEPVHHGMSAMAMKHMEEFTKLGGILTGSKAPTHERYEGAPRPYLKELTTTAEKLGLGSHHSNKVAPRTTTTTTTSTTTSFSRRPAPIDTTVPQTQKTTAVTPTRTTGLVESSPRSSTSSNPSMPSTPTNNNFTNPTIRSDNGMSPQMSPQRVSMEGKNANNNGFLGRIRSRNSASQPTRTY